MFNVQVHWTLNRRMCNGDLERYRILSYHAMSLGSKSDLMSINPTTHCPSSSSWQLQLASQHFILRTNHTCKGSENYKFAVHAVANTLGCAGGSPADFAAGSRTAHLRSAFRNAFFSNLIALFIRKNCDRDASMELSTDF